MHNFSGRFKNYDTLWSVWKHNNNRPVLNVSFGIGPFGMYSSLVRLECQRVGVDARDVARASSSLCVVVIRLCLSVQSRLKTAGIGWVGTAGVADPRARVGASHIRVGVSECGPSTKPSRAPPPVSVWFQYRVVFLKARHLDMYACTLMRIRDFIA